jgi:glutamate decarboxylase
MPLHASPPSERSDEEVSIRPEFAQPGELQSVPRFRLADRTLPAQTAYQLVHDELLLDGNSRLNLATFVGTWMEPQARVLIEECLDKNVVDRDESPQTAELELRCVSILAELWSSPQAERATGCSTTGSSEACMLGGLALKWRWRERRRREGKPTDRPNLVMGANVQVCWEKFCRYWDVEPRRMALEPGRTCLTADGAIALCDENTIGVLAILGSTFDGAYEPVSEIAGALDSLQRRTGMDIPIHVDAASGGFVAPFLDPELEWDFRLPRVQSINASGHKYGLVYPNLGWVVWREKDALPDDLVFEVNYLGGTMPTFALNFSRSGAPVVAQYYTMVRLGQDGFRRVQQACRDTAEWLAHAIADMGPFELISDGSTIPVFAFRLKDEANGYSVFDLSEALRLRGWQVPAYTLPANLQDTAVLRAVVRNGFGQDLAQLLARDLRRATEHLADIGPLPPHEQRSAFHH